MTSSIWTLYAINLKSEFIASVVDQNNHTIYVQEHTYDSSEVKLKQRNPYNGLHVCVDICVEKTRLKPTVEVLECFSVLVPYITEWNRKNNVAKDVC